MSKKNSVYKKILFAAAGLAGDGITPLPEKGAALRNLSKWYKNQDRRGRYRIRKTFAKLRRSGLIEPSAEEETGRNIALTETGKKRVFGYQLADLKLKKPKRWDKKWRIVIFNIPQTLRSNRNFLQHKLRNFGFRAVQKGVWVYPHKCRNEINFIAESLKVQKHVKLIEAASFGNEKLFEEWPGL